MIKKIRPTFLLFLLIFSITLSAFANSGHNIKTLGDVFEDLGISMDGVADFVIHKNILREGLENTFWTIVAKRGEWAIKIEIIKNIDAGYAYKYIEERQGMIESLYKRIPSPYPGMISKAIECPDKFKPKLLYLEIDKKNTPIYILYSTPRFTYGACADELISYRGALTFIYCEKEKILYKIELFIPKKDFDKEEILSILGSFKFQQPAETNEAETKEEKSVSAQEDRGSFKGYNLVIIGFDPLGARHIGTYGYFRDTTPNLDKFSKGSFLFKNAISPSSWTLPVFMSWFTSLYPSQHKIINKYSTFTEEKQICTNLAEISPQVTTLAQVLKEDGYATAGFTGGAGVGGIFGYGLGFDVYYDKTDFAGFDIVFPLALDWLKKHQKDKFFLFIQAYDVHGRHQLPKDFKNKFAELNYKGKYKGTPGEYLELRNLSLDREYLDMTDEDVDFWRSWYDTKIYDADKKLGDFLGEFHKLGIENKTIIVISSASGNEFYEHKKFDHGYSLYDELIHVPLLVEIPGKTGGVIKQQVRTIDIMPTILELLDISCDGKIKHQMQGVSLIPLMRGEDLQLDAFSETDYLLCVFKRSLRTPKGWKFIYSLDTGQKELYNLKEDPYELNNLIEKEKKVAYELAQKLFIWLKSVKQ